MSQQETQSQLTLFVEASPARICPLPESGRGWLENEAGYGLSTIEFYQSLSRSGWLSKMSPVYYPLTEDGTLPSYFEGWQNSGIYRPGACWTLNTSEFPNAAAVCSLSQVLEMDAPPKYYLSAKACQGILRRAEKRGKELPAILQTALHKASGSIQPMA